jgi:hypothetical protein
MRRCRRARECSRCWIRDCCTSACCRGSRPLVELVPVRLPGLHLRLGRRQGASCLHSLSRCSASEPGPSFSSSSPSPPAALPSSSRWRCACSESRARGRQVAVELLARSRLVADFLLDAADLGADGIVAAPGPQPARRCAPLCEALLLEARVDGLLLRVHGLETHLLLADRRPRRLPVPAGRATAPARGAACSVRSSSLAAPCTFPPPAAWRCRCCSWRPSSSRRSVRRSRFSSVRRMRDSVSRRRSLYLEIPAASSINTRSSSGLDSIRREIMPCSMIA